MSKSVYKNYSKKAWTFSFLIALLICGLLVLAAIFIYTFSLQQDFKNNDIKILVK
jgi:hypothetical protein